METGGLTIKQCSVTQWMFTVHTTCDSAHIKVFCLLHNWHLMCAPSVAQHTSVFCYTMELNMCSVCNSVHIQSNTLFLARQILVFYYKHFQISYFVLKFCSSTGNDEIHA